MGTIKTGPGTGGRFYFDSEDPSKRLPGVTSVIGVIPKNFLRWWYAKQAGERAVQSVDIINRMAAVNESSAVKFLASAADDYTKGRSKIGTQAHILFEQMIRGETLGHLPMGMSHYVAHFQAFLDTMQPELLRAEDVAWSDTHGYAGSFDAILRIKLDDQGRPDPTGDPAVVVVDWKTSRDVYQDVAMQLAAYANADRIIDPDGTSVPMIPTDGALVVHVKPEFCKVHPVDIGADVFAMFLDCLRFFTAVRGWEGEGRGRTRVTGIKEKVIGQPIFTTQGLVTGTERREL